ncbi:hypothetical protein KFL_010410040 [Klebsormidium nitens]|uniref:Uncharacterized protein n=1 Tax=Klebsormidium nitens TaxID=105231 RepID=A0A1Y1IT87_KLENI|nr:hypothetical protein KFL_010410040 [Klebsormidium nitens]|eukprot:GAQ92531.1 hypothetical protein KFL_010410040 [Klebsormidium nitens]
MLRALSHILGGTAALDEGEAQLIESLRPSLNAVIAALDDKLTQRGLGRIFVTGGDAMRRFNNRIKTSKNIDTKIYVGHGQSTKPVVELTTHVCGKTVTMMIDSRKNILPRDAHKKAGREARDKGLGLFDQRLFDYLLDEGRQPTIPDYLALFYWAKERKRYLPPEEQGGEKQKVPFSQKKLDEWRQEMQTHLASL